MSYFDAIAALILLVSGAVGFIRGGAREVITVLAFIVSVAIAILALRLTGPVARHLVNPDWLANMLALLVNFVIAYLAIRIAGSRITRKIHTAKALTVVDRAVGVAFGLLRGLVLLGLTYLLFTLATPAERLPGWIKDAALYPLSAASGHVLLALAPKGAEVANTALPALEDAMRDGTSDRAKAPPAGQGEGYDAESRDRVDELVEKNR